MCEITYKKLRTDSGGHFKTEASLTVEAALVFPLFFFTIWAFWQLFLIMLLELEIAGCVSKTASTFSAVGFIERKSEEEKCETEELLWIPDFYLNAAEGVIPLTDFLWVKLKNEDDSADNIEITADFVLRVPLLGNTGFPMKRGFKVHSYTGTWDKNVFLKPQEEPEKEENEGKYYVTENGTVYHRDESCSYISVKTEAVNEEVISGKRNRDGKKYTECVYCRNKKHSGTVYITSYGEKYHYGADCPILKRSVRAVTKEEIRGLRPCSKCGGE